MRLLTYEFEGVTTVGVEENGLVSPVGRKAERFGDLGAVVRAGALNSLEPIGPAASLEDVRIKQPVVDPGAVFCIGSNYRAHIQEMGRDLPDYPTIFTKLPRALTDPGAEILLPRASQKVDYEAEVTVVVGKGGRNIPAEHAWDAVAGLTLMNDVTCAISKDGPCNGLLARRGRDLAPAVRFW